MDNNNNIPQIYDSTKEMHNEDINNVFSSRYDDRYDNRYDNRYYDNRYDRNYNRGMRYYQYPYCDRYGRCENPMWWLFWPFFFL